MRDKLARWVRDGFFGIAFWQILLTPYLFLWLKMDMAAYGRWCIANMLISFVAGPAFVHLYKWAIKP